METKKGIIFTGSVIGFMSVALVLFGNPQNMGLCIACFLRDITGALGLHRAEVVQYIRPEIIGIVLGAFFMALGKKEFRVKGGSAPFLRFCSGILIMIGALMFLGCPLRMVLRLAAGDLNALVGLVGFAAGIVLGVYCLNKGFSLKRNYLLSTFEGFVFPTLNVGLLVLLLMAPAFIFFSVKGPGSQYAPIWMTLVVGAVVGVLGQRTRLCTVGGIRDWLMFRQSYLLLGFLAILISATLANLVSGYYHLSFVNQPVAHSDGLWNFLGLFLVGWGSVLVGGCPMRQLILSGEGNVDSVITVMGLVAGAAIAHNFGLAASPAGPTLNGKIAVLIGLAFFGLLAFINRERDVQELKKGGVRAHV